MVYSKKRQIRYSWTSASVKLSYEWLIQGQELNHQVADRGKFLTIDMPLIKR